MCIALVVKNWGIIIEIKSQKTCKVKNVLKFMHFFLSQTIICLCKPPCVSIESFLILPSKHCLFCPYCFFKCLNLKKTRILFRFCALNIPVQWKGVCRQVSQNIIATVLSLSTNWIFSEIFRWPWQKLLKLNISWFYD